MKPSCVTLSDGDDGWIGLLAVVGNAVLLLTKIVNVCADLSPYQAPVPAKV